MGRKEALQGKEEKFQSLSWRVSGSDEEKEAFCPTETRICQPGKGQTHWSEMDGRIEERP